MLTLTAPPPPPRIGVAFHSLFKQHIIAMIPVCPEGGKATLLCTKHLTQAPHIMNHRLINHHEAFWRRHRINLCDGRCYLLTDSVQRAALKKCISCPKYSKNKCCDKSFKLPETFYFLFPRLLSFHYFIKQQGGMEQPSMSCERKAKSPALWRSRVNISLQQTLVKAVSDTGHVSGQGSAPIWSLRGWGHCTAICLPASPPEVSKNFLAA